VGGVPVAALAGALAWVAALGVLSSSQGCTVETNRLDGASVIGADDGQAADPTRDSGSTADGSDAGTTEDSGGSVDAGLDTGTPKDAPADAPPG
jgi:hypothetical protein